MKRRLRLWGGLVALLVVALLPLVAADDNALKTRGQYNGRQWVGMSEEGRLSFILEYGDHLDLSVKLEESKTGKHDDLAFAGWPSPA